VGACCPPFPLEPTLYEHRRTRAMHRRSTIALALSWALASTLACDTRKQDEASQEAQSEREDAAKPAGAETPTPDPELAEVAAGGRIDITVDAKGYHPETIRAPAKSKITLAFKRTTEAGCGQQLVIAALGINKELPLNQVVEIEVEVPERGELGFACGMDMYRGKVVPKA